MRGMHCKSGHKRRVAVMWFKWVGAGLILTAGVLLGNIQAKKLRARVRELEEFKLALRLLAAEIGYTATPLPRAFAFVCTRLEGMKVQVFFAEASRLLKETEITDAAAAWTRAARHVRGELALTEKDWAVLSRAAAGLGGLGREDQVKQLAAAEVQLVSHAADAAALCEGGEKMWRYLGVLGGMAVVILLL